MKTVVEGVLIELTAQQIKKIEMNKKRRTTYGRRFERVLKKFGFKRMNTSSWENPNQNCYEHEENGWFAEILNQGNYNYVFMAGKGLKNSGFPGGHCYDETEDVEIALNNALAEISK